MANIDIHNSFRELRNGKKIPIRRKEPDLKKRKKVEQEAQVSDEVEEINEDSDNLNEEPEEKDDSENDDEESDNNDYNKGYYADVTDELNKMKNDLSFEKSSDVQNIHLRKLDTKPSSGNCAKYTIWISILIAIVGILAVCLNSRLMANRDRDNQSDKLVLWKKAFANLLDKYGDALPEISQKVINKSVQSVLKRQVPSEKFNNCEPAVILLIGSKHNMQAVKCIFLELSRSVAKIFGEKQSPVLNAEKMTRIDLDNQFHDILGHQSLHSIALDGIEQLKGDDALSLHPFTDHDKAPYLDVIIILTAYSNSRFTNSSLQIQQIDSIANNILELSWGQILPSEQVAGLLSRITPSVAIVSDTNESQNWHCE